MIRFSRDVLPIVSDKCFACHGPDPEVRKADLRLDLEREARRVVSMKADGTSDLTRRISSEDPDERMPPPDFLKPLTAREREILIRWVSAGAPYEGHWAYQTPKRSALPEVRGRDWLRNEIDTFILSRIETEGRRPSSPADRRTLIRRLSLDLVGLPPTLKEVEAFVSDARPDAYERVVDRLLESPRYGEHMAVAWLEAARYADTDGYQNDRYRYQHVWRDWVILAFNENKPYDEFVIEQLAGDLIPEATLRQQIATGFCRNHRINSEDGSIPAEWLVENVVDRVDTMGAVFLGLTLGCARCHDHKYDPISQREYYQLFAYFNNVTEWGVGPNNGNSPPFIEVPPDWPDVAPHANRAVAPEPLALRRAREESGNGLQRPQPGGTNTVMVMHERAERRPTHLLLRGQYHSPDPSEELLPAVPAVLNAGIGAEPKDRLGLARWLVHPDHPLTSRVAVNRLWRHLFGRGLVETGDNFGVQGAFPSHPELLDWLALEFIRSGWDVKGMQKRLVMSATYRQASNGDGASWQRDPENRLHSRGPRFRLSGFQLRDGALALSGLLVHRFGGPPAKPYMPPKIWKAFSNNAYQRDDGENLYRRSVYTYWRRTIPPPAMVNFDAASRETCIVQSERTNTPLQALTLMNHPGFFEAARFLAARILSESGSSPRQRIEYGFRLVTSREPSAQELEELHWGYQAFAEDYAADPQAALESLSVGEGSSDLPYDPETWATMTMVASLLLNLDEVIMRP